MGKKMTAEKSRPFINACFFGGAIVTESGSKRGMTRSDERKKKGKAYWRQISRGRVLPKIGVKRENLLTENLLPQFD